MSTEQRDKAATGYVEFIENFDECVKAEFDFSAGWDAHAATMPDREAVKANLWAQLEEALTEGPLFDMNNPRECSRFDELMGKTADAVLALLNKEGEE